MSRTAGSVVAELLSENRRASNRKRASIETFCSAFRVVWLCSVSLVGVASSLFTRRIKFERCAGRNAGTFPCPCVFFGRETEAAECADAGGISGEGSLLIPI